MKLKNKLLILGFNLIIFSPLSGQIEEFGSASGKVADSVTGEVIINVSVYVSGTMIGTLTDANGSFLLKKVPAGNQIIVVSIVGYKPELRQLNIFANSELKLEFKLTELAIEMNTIQITGRNTKEWQKYLNIFKQYFLAQTVLSKTSVIINQDELNLKKNEQGFIEAECPQPLVVTNEELGFRIDCVLLKFVCNDARGKAEIIFTIEAFSLKTDKEELKNRWKTSIKNVIYFE